MGVMRGQEESEAVRPSLQLGGNAAADRLGLGRPGGRRGRGAERVIVELELLLLAATMTRAYVQGR